MRLYKGQRIVGAGFTPALLRLARTSFVLWSLRLHCQADAWRSQGGRTSAMANMAVKSGMKKGSGEAPFFVFCTMRWAAARAAPTDSCLSPFLKGRLAAWPVLRRR